MESLDLDCPNRFVEITDCTIPASQNNSINRLYQDDPIEAVYKVRYLSVAAKKHKSTVNSRFFQGFLLIIVLFNKSWTTHWW